jgi:hypothetical protein
MPVTKELLEFINGFKVIKDLGRFDNDIRYALVICKECNSEFTTSVYHIKKIKSCGCLPISIAKNLPNDINGFKILQDYGYKNGSRRALAICKECNNEYQVDPNKLKYRKNCGCIKNGSKVSKYSLSHPRLINIYQHMKGRCYRRKDKDYYNYGKRGITICNEWKNSADEFCKWALENGYLDNLSIDRINSNGNYEPNNCRWANAKTQARNSRQAILTLELAGEIRKLYPLISIEKLADKYKVSQATIWNVINNKSWMA